MLEIRMLGQYSIQRGGIPVEVQSRPAQALLAYLSVNANTPIRREKLAGMFWPETSDSDARRNLRVVLHGLRRDLQDDGRKGGQFIQSDRQTIALDTSNDCWIDTLELETLQRQTKNTDRLTEQLPIYAGELLPGFYDNWVVLERERYRAIFEDCIFKLIEDLLAAGQHREVIEWGERWIALGQVPEPAYRAIMLAHYACGDIASAASTYRRCVQALRQELGVQPSQQTRDVYQAILQDVQPAHTLTPIVLGQRGPSAAASVHTLFKQWRKQGEFFLDLPSLAMIYACRPELYFDPDEIAVLLRSAIHHGVEIQPWIEQTSSPEQSIEIFCETLHTNPPQAVRLRIVEAAGLIEGEAAAQFLFDMVKTDDSTAVRTSAATVAAEKGLLRPVIIYLQERQRENNDPGAFAALVAVADQFGIPSDLRNGSYILIGLALAQRRWRRDRTSVYSLIWKATAAAGLSAGIYGFLIPILFWLFNYSRYLDGVAEYSLIGWMLIDLLAGLFAGSLQGAASSLTAAIIDTLWPSNTIFRRLIFGALAGLAYGSYLTIFGIAGVYYPESASYESVDKYIFLGFGLCFGALLSLLIPHMHIIIQVRDHIIRIAFVLPFVILSTWAYLILLLGGQANQAYIGWGLEPLAIALGLGLGMLRLENVRGAPSWPIHNQERITNDG